MPGHCACVTRPAPFELICPRIDVLQAVAIGIPLVGGFVSGYSVQDAPKSLWFTGMKQVSRRLCARADVTVSLQCTHARQAVMPMH